MTRKALLIGAQTYGLTGVLNDVRAMGQALEPHGFQVAALVTPHATRGEILDAYEKLIVDAHDDDAIVIYYSGHGGRLQSMDDRDLQFVVPDDYGDSGEDDFRGITGVELSVLLARLTSVAPNTTVILDCCHAAHMSRQPNRRVRSLLRPVHLHLGYDFVEHHLEKLARAGLAVQLRSLVSNPHAVRVVACAPSESAWEGSNRDGVEMGLFTDALSRALREAHGLRLNWSTLVDAVRRHVQECTPAQRPEAEGPSERELFELTTLEPLDTLPVAAIEPGLVQLLGAPLLGVEVGDEFAIMPGRAVNSQDGPPIGTATVHQLLPTAALAQLRLEASAPEVPADARAHRTRAAAPTLAVRLPEDHPVTAELVEAMALRPLLRRADPETAGNGTVEVACNPDGSLVVRDDGGPLHPPYPATAWGVGAVVANLQRIAQAAALRRLAGDPARPLDHHLVVEWGTVRDGHEQLLPPSGALLFSNAAERVFFRMRNEGEQTVFVSLIDIGISHRIRLLTRSDPGGIRLRPGSSYTYGWNEDLRRLVGVQVTWPEGLDTAIARPETVIALISDGPVDVGVLHQQEVRATLGRPSASRGLEQQLSQIATGTTREIGDASVEAVRFDVRPIEFMMIPAAPPSGEHARFLVDDRPELPIRLLAPRGVAARIAVRLVDLIVHRNRTLGSAGIRVDAIVQAGTDGDEPVHRAETLRFSDVGDECRLPLDDVLIYSGPVVDFLDLAVWVSRDAAGSPPLSDLLANRLIGQAVQTAGIRPAGLPLAAPQAAVAALGAGAVLVNTAHEILTGAGERSIGLYRTSLLAQENFGVGRHERQLQDFSFTFSIEVLS